MHIRGMAKEQIKSSILLITEKYVKTTIKISFYKCLLKLKNIKIWVECGTKESIHGCWCCLVTQSCPTLWNPMNWSPPGSSVHGDFPDKHTGVGCHFLLQTILPTQGLILPTQGLNLYLVHWQADSLLLSYLGSPKYQANLAYTRIAIKPGVFSTTL